MVGGVEYTFLIHVVGGVEYSLPCISFTKRVFFIFIFLSGKIPSLLSVIIIILFIYLFIGGGVVWFRLWWLACFKLFIVNKLESCLDFKAKRVGGFLGDYIMFSLLLD